MTRRVCRSRLTVVPASVDLWLQEVYVGCSGVVWVTTSSSCTGRSGDKKAHWAVEHLAHLFRTTKDKTTQVARGRGQGSGDLELAAYLADAVRPVNLVLDLRLTQERFGSSCNPLLMTTCTTLLLLTEISRYMKLLLTRYVTNVLIIIIVPLTWSASLPFIYLFTHSLTPRTSMLAQTTVDRLKIAVLPDNSVRLMMDDFRSSTRPKDTQLSQQQLCQ